MSQEKLQGDGQLDDPIVDEVRRAREAYAAQFNFDLRAICEDLRRRTEEAAQTGRKVGSPALEETAKSAPAKKAG